MTAFRTTDPPPEPQLFDLFEEPGGSRPDLLLEPQGQQTRVERHAVRDFEHAAPQLQVLDVPVAQVEGTQQLDSLMLYDALGHVQCSGPLVEVMAVPRPATLDRTQQRFVAPVVALDHVQQRIVESLFLASEDFLAPVVEEPVEVSCAHCFVFSSWLWGTGGGFSRALACSSRKRSTKY